MEMFNREKKNLITELIHGLKAAKHAQALLGADPPPQPSSSSSSSSSSCLTTEMKESLLHEIVSSNERAILMLNGSIQHNPKTEPVELAADPVANSGKIPKSPAWITGLPDLNQKYKRKKDYYLSTTQVRISPERGFEELHDFFSWRKYGCKDILGARYPRNYFRCIFRSTQNCKATKQVQRSDGDPTIFEVTYRGIHTCSHVIPPPEKRENKPNPTVINDQNDILDNLRTNLTVCSPLNSETNRNLEGRTCQLKSILSLLNCSQSSAPHIVGLWGMAGIGKTTITREIFRAQAEKYDVCFFLPDFHLMCQTKGLGHLRDEFFSKIFGEEKVFIDACDTKLSFTRDRFLGKRVLIVLDGVSAARDAEVLLGGFGWFSGGHTIILTSRNRQVLVQCNAKEIYKIQELSEPESLSLCCQFATEQYWKGRMPLISELVNYASGNPLALRVLGSSLQMQCINDEKQHLRRLRQHPPIEIHDAFRESFNGLDDNEKNTFLDLACFFKGENKDHVVNILDGCGFLTDLGICGLIDESLISLVDNTIEMPNIFQVMGRFVVCQEHEEAGKRSRLSDSNDIADVLKNNSGTEAIEGIFFDASDLTFELSSTVFESLYRLRLLKLHCETSENHCNVCLPQGLHSLPDELRLLHWERYPLRSLPRNFNPKNLVELNMPYSNLTKLWKGTKNLEKLKRIILTHSRQLTKFPRLSKARNLEHIDLEGCTSLVKVNSSILHHHKLTFLSLKDCSHLRIMPTTAHLESLEVLNLSGCLELEDLQDFSPNLKELYLAGTAIKEMPSSFEDLTRLVTLDLENCKRLQHLPPGISNLKAMVTLKLSGCSSLKNHPTLDALF